MDANKVVIGDPAAPLLVFENDAIESITEDASVSMVGAELSIDQFVPIVRYELLIRYVIVPKDVETYQRILTAEGLVLCGKYNYDIRAIPYGTEIRFYVNERLAGLYYVSDVERTGGETFKLSCVSAVGLMDKQRHIGGIYTGERFDWLIHDIIGDEYQYEIDAEVASLQVYGWLPYSTKRANLHQLLIAYGVNITKSDLGGMLFNFMKATDSYDIPPDRIYSGGNVTYGDPASRVELLEHAYHYLPSVEFTALFDTRETVADNTVVAFKEPIYPDSLAVEEGGTLEIIERGVNYAIVSGSGVLIGQPYTHTTRRLVAENPEAVTEKIVSVEEATLITMANADNCLARISGYYFSSTTVTNSIRLEDEKPGRRYAFQNAFREYTSAFMTSMSMRTSNIMRAECEYVEGYVPIAQGSSFLHRTILRLADYEQVWYVPESVYAKDVPQIRVVLIGEGYDGEDGADGASGEYAGELDGGKGGTGGKGGAGGIGGKILSTTIDCSNLAFLRYGRTDKNTWLKAGDDYYSSATGLSSRTGFVDMFTGAVYGLPGEPGTDGADGGQGGTNPALAQHGPSIDATDGSSLDFNGVTYKGGKKGKKQAIRAQQYWSGYHQNMTWRFGGCGGGGAAVGNNGLDAGELVYGDEATKHLPYGGQGADAVAPQSTIPMYGTGGNGGHGGGGGGGATNHHWWNDVYTTLIGIVTDGTEPGPGGEGSPGSKGYEGCVIIYY